MLLKFYAIIWVIVQIMGIACLGAQIGLGKNIKTIIASLIGLAISIPIYVCGFLYIFNK